MPPDPRSIQTAAGVFRCVAEQVKDIPNLHAFFAAAELIFGENPPLTLRDFSIATNFLASNLEAGRDDRARMRVGTLSFLASLYPQDRGTDEELAVACERLSVAWRIYEPVLAEWRPQDAEDLAREHALLRGILARDTLGYFADLSLARPDVAAVLEDLRRTAAGLRLSKQDFVAVLVFVPAADVGRARGLPAVGGEAVWGEDLRRPRGGCPLGQGAASRGGHRVERHGGRGRGRYVEA